MLLPSPIDSIVPIPRWFCINIINIWAPSLKPLSPSFDMGWTLRSRTSLSIVFSWPWSSWRLLEVSMPSSTFDPSVVQWFFQNTAEREEGTYRLILAHSRFPDNAPFLNTAQHAGFVAPFNDSLEPPLHCRMFALEMALPHHGLGNWEDLVPAIPSLDQATQAWEAMMLDLIHFVTDAPPPDVPLLLPDPMLPTSPLLPNPSPPPPPLFGTVTTLAIDLMGEDDDKDIYESLSSRGHCLEREVMEADGMEVDEGVPVKSELSVA
ncbi:hypothetical protein EV368DRAFT_87717 [Lentinula lateritia]|nr:hypothetical protein EV368DRAFT_87717 [Lentinula lateritia]